MRAEKRNRLKESGILVLPKTDGEQEMEFELDYLSALPLEQRFSLMLAKSRELKLNLRNHGHRKTTQVIKRK